MNSVSGNNLGLGSVSGNNLGVGSVSGNNLGVGSVSGNNISINSVNASNTIVAGTITGNLLGTSAINSNNIVDLAVLGNDLGIKSVSGNNLGLTSVSSNNIVSNVSINTSRIVESINTSTVAATGTITINILDSAIHYYQGNVVSNVTVNLRGNSTAALGEVLNVGQSSSIAVLIPVGGTQYVIQTIQIDGVAQTVKWGANTKPAYNVSPPNSFIDSYSIIAIKDSPSSYIVLASNTAFGVGV